MLLANALSCHAGMTVDDSFHHAPYRSTYNLCMCILLSAWLSVIGELNNTSHTMFYLLRMSYSLNSCEGVI